MFEWLFNYPLAVWREAALVFDSSWPVALLPAALFLVCVVIVVSLWRRSISVGRRFTVAALQIAFAAIALLMLWQPALLVAISEKGENTVAWVVDHSGSMLRPDASPRAGDDVSTRFESAVGIVESIALDDASDFTPSLHGIGVDLSAVESMDELRGLAESANTDIAGGLSDLLSAINDTALAAVVLLSDGADNAQQFSAQWWKEIEASGVPIHTVGIGQSQDLLDVELADVSVPDRVPPNSLVNARVRVHHAQAQTARIRVSAGKDLLFATDIELPADTNQSIHSIRFPSGESGVRQLEFSIESGLLDSDGLAAIDPIPGNNRQPRIIQVIDSPKRILYVEGEPRWEYKFIRRALHDNPSVEIVSLLKTSPNKFYRQGVESAAELANGFPRTREELFRYDAVIIGSLDAAELLSQQQAALRDFVSVRGGSLLMLAGRQGLADGGWGRSVTAAALPVVLSNRLNSDTFSRTRWKAVPTLAGLRTPWLRLTDDDTEIVDAWQGLPALADAQGLGLPKPGAVTLLERVSLEQQTTQTEPLLVTQRYGKGRSSVLGTSGTWRWQMSLPSDDDRHERFWIQLLGALVDSTLPQVDIELEQAVLRDAQIAKVSVTAFNADYSAMRLANYPVKLSTPDGLVETIQLYADEEQPGRYTGEVPVGDVGAYSISASSMLDGESPSVRPLQTERWWIGEKNNAELYGSQLNDELLKRISEVTGGKYVALDDIDELYSIVTENNVALKRENRLPLWNMPFFFLCLLLFKVLEWLLRLKWKRL